MKSVNAHSHIDEVVTQEVLTKAIKRGAQRADTGVRAQKVHYLQSLQSLLIVLADQSAVSLPIKNYPELACLHEDELKSLELGFGGSALCLEARDLHVSIGGLLSASQPLMEMAATLVAARNGSKSTAAKAQAARENGKSGGRPRLLRVDPAAV
jgi:hypothetical protein